MANRLTKIYTRTGDRGETGLAGGDRVPKDHVLVHAMGDVDELNSLLGLLVCRFGNEVNSETRAMIKTIQNDLFDLGAELNLSTVFINQQHIDWLEQKLDIMNAELPPLKEFILPGGGETATVCHLARSVCRRAERSLVSAGREQKINAELMAYINRLSDLLFVLARYIAKQSGEKEVYWQSERLKT